ncbi:hypothetical protein SEA_MOAB_144 [Streptomyces phage Moab]|nr:hypothetical protein SEA_MOAB_144 [Streptomyces phage Moab]WMI33759.1 hypothetical protein SEA_PATELGO_146 [Streptomyces phage Patelgo]
MGIFKRRFPFKKKDCPHMHIRNIYGDEIIAAGFKRSRCMDCGKFFNNLNGR